MTWEETIEYIRKEPEYANMVEKAYFDEDLMLNINRFSKSEEFEKTLELIKTHQPNAKKILDIGCGNGISAINFAIKGFTVTAVEPDPSNTIGAGAIRKLKEINQLKNIEIHEALAEDINFEDSLFDVVYIRQAMHHAMDLNKFIKEAVRVLKPNGLLLTIRDHVIFNEKDKEWFLENHPLQKFYGGENAFTPQEYKNAIQSAGGTILKELKYYDSVINYFPTTTNEINQKEKQYYQSFKLHLKQKIGFLANFPLVFELYKFVKGIDASKQFDEKKVPGRMYSYIALKK